MRQLLDNNYYDQIVGNRATLRKPQRSILIDVYLTDIEKLKLMVAYSEFDIKYAANPKVHPHAMLAAMRRCELHMLLLLCGYRFEDFPKDYDCAVADVGGSFLAHFFAGRSNVHVCNPILSPRDDCRYSEQLTNVARRIDLTANQVRMQRQQFKGRQ